MLNEQKKKRTDGIRLNQIDEVTLLLFGAGELSRPHGILGHIIFVFIVIANYFLL